MHRQRILQLVLAVALLAAAAPAHAGPECEEDRHCLKDEVCGEAGLCVPAVPCEGDEDCGENEICAEDAFCRRDPRLGAECADDGDCLEGELCERGVCVEDTSGCAEDTDCADGERCNTDTGDCIPLPDEGEPDPPDGGASPPGAECELDTHCLANEICQGGLCVEVPSSVNPPPPEDDGGCRLLPGGAGSRAADAGLVLALLGCAALALRRRD